MGFFDGIHLGHREVIKNAVKYAKDIQSAKVLLLTFPKAPEEYFHKKFEYIYSREYNNELIKSLGVTDVEETDFLKVVNLAPEDYIRMIVSQYEPAAIFTGFNYRFGKDRKGDCKTLADLQKKYNYNYFKIPELKVNNQTVSSTKIKEFLHEGDIINANNFLGANYTISSKVIKGNQLGRKIGFPTANLKYPEGILKIPHGVYKAKAICFHSMLNWGIKPTINDNGDEIVEVHLINYKGDLYNKILEVEIIRKIRDEKKFDSLEDLISQIEKDRKECLR